MTGREPSVYTFPPFFGGQCYSIADIPTLPMGARGRRLPRQARRSRLPPADGLGWHQQQPSGDDSALAAVDEVRAKTTQFDKAGEVVRDASSVAAATRRKGRLSPRPLSRGAVLESADQDQD